jgi:hypothetical protein
MNELKAMLGERYNALTPEERKQLAAALRIGGQMLAADGITPATARRNHQRTMRTNFKVRDMKSRMLSLKVWRMWK